MKTIEVTISPTGESTVQNKGFTGSSCRDASKFIEQALGDKTAETLTAEFHQTAMAQSSWSSDSRTQQTFRSHRQAASPLRPADWLSRRERTERNIHEWDRNRTVRYQARVR